MTIPAILPRLIRLRDPPTYLGMDRYRFNVEVRPQLMEIPIGDQGISFYRVDLDAWADDYKSRNGRRVQGVTSRTINHALKVVRHILNLATKEWFDENGLSWLDHSTRIKLVPEPDLRKPYPLSWEEQGRLFRALPAHLDRMCLFKVNTGCRDAEVCGLRWVWELKINEFNTSVFIIPAHTVKNGTDRLVVLNNVAKSVIESVRGQHSEYVFTYRGRRIQRINNTG